MLKKIVDLHHHLDTLENLLVLRSRIQSHSVRLEDHFKKNTQTILSVALYPRPWQAFQDLVAEIKNLKNQIDSFGSLVRHIQFKSDLEGDFSVGIILHLESARLITRPEWQLALLRDLGIRGVIPLHFVDNHIGQSCDDPLRRFGIKKHDSGLTDIGAKFIEKLNSLGMWVDVSHSSDKTGEDILLLADEVMASHIAIRDLTKRARNKPLEFFRKLSQKKGIFGLQPWQHLVGNDQHGLFNHMKCAIDSGLKESVCLGTDFGAPIKTHKSIKSLFDCATVTEQFPDYSNLITYENALRFFRRALPN